jgi:type VI secretion system secreted protein VgrG
MTGMSRLPQVGYLLRCTDGPATDDWRVIRFRMHEAICEPYQLHVDVATSDVDAEFEDLVGASVEFEIQRGELSRVVMGVIAGVEWLGVAQRGYLQLRLDIRPAFALLDQRIDSRLWQDKSALEIIDEVLQSALGDYSRTYSAGDVSRGQTPRTYCTQYRESDLAFVTRLLEEEGISYHFVHNLDKGHEVLTFYDANNQLEAALNVDESEIFPLVIHNPDEVDVESVQGVEWRRKLTSTDVLRRDFDWMTPTELLSAESGEADARGRKRRTYVHGQRRFQSDELAQRAGDRKAGEVLPGTRGFGRSNACDLRAGRTLVIEGHELPALGEDLVVVRVEHEGIDPSAMPASESASSLAGGYRNLFECVPASLEQRPTPRTPKPRVHGPQTAIVCGASGEEIDCDEHGRIRVQFHWQETPTYDESSSCWVRVAQSWAGPSWGSQFIPRIGMEVVVEFLEGNPDRPLVTGCVYNGNNAPPFALPGDKTQSGIRTNSSPGGGGSNELRFEDAAGSEEIYLHGQKDWTIAIENDKNQTVGHDETLAVGNDRSKTVGHDEAISIGNNQTISVGVDETETIGSNLTLTVGSNQTVTIGSNQTVSVGANRSETIGASASETVAIAKAITVGAAMQVTVGAAHNLTVGAASAEEIGGMKSVNVGVNHSDSVAGTRSIAAGKDFVVNAGKKGTIQTGAALGIMTADKLSMNSKKDMMIGSGAKALFEAKDELTIKCGSAQITLKKNGDITIKGKKITIDGSGDIVMKGSKITQN